MEASPAFAFEKAVIFYLPTISLDVNSEVVLRNLVAYEASKPSGPLNGIIDSEEDVKLLKEKGIILNHLNSDAEVAKLWNGMSKSIKLTKVPFLDKNPKLKTSNLNCFLCLRFTPSILFFSDVCSLRRHQNNESPSGVWFQVEQPGASSDAR
ncbi:unnamed protein product [Citrullus colocynthis]|uniref:Uncharacterized protein n=1 Tax=Citrullus colocynthis TaxID=252529 RepID=A0ABP0XUI0_9ROSI